MLNVRQLTAFMAVYEERSFSRAAVRIHATQSGLSAQVAHLETDLGLRVFERTPKGVVPTHAGESLYRHGNRILRAISHAETEVRTLSATVSGRVRAGLMPAFTHGILPHALRTFLDEHAHVDVTIVEAYSSVLVDEVARGDFDFAIVPGGRHLSEVSRQRFGRDQEVLVAGPASGFTHLDPVRLAALAPLKLVLPTVGNARREQLDEFFLLNHVPIAAVLELDSMVATLELVAETDWLTILPRTICANDLHGVRRTLSPIVRPRAHIEYFAIEPQRKVLSPPARLFLDAIRSEFRRTQGLWTERVRTA